LEGVTIYPHKSFLRALKKIPKADQANLNAAISRLPGSIGNPHQHSGAGVRRLHPGISEIRAGLRLRVCSRSEPIMFFCTLPGITTRCRTG
jgi:hypothetical protein